MTHEPMPSGSAARKEAQPLSENVHVLHLEGKVVYVVGTAHISARSVTEVKETIQRLRPDTVCVELDEARHKALMSRDAWRDMDVVQVVRRKQATLLLAHLVLSAFQRRLGEHLGVKPGAEMVQALHSAGEAGATVVLADRQIQITLRRTWAHLRWWDKLKLISHLLFTVVLSPSIGEEEIEALKQTDMLSQVMEGFAKAFPRAKAVLIDERDIYLAEKIRSAPGTSVVAVVGAGHVAGIRRHLETTGGSVDLTPLLAVPARGHALKILQWGIPALVLGLIGYGFFSANAQVSLRMVEVWVLANGILAALGTLLALAHPLTVVVAFLAAPLTSLNPMVAAGWVAGLSEALLRHPKVRDFENLPDDITTLKGFWRNGITRILLVVALANLGSSIGTLIGIPMMTRLLG